MSWYVDMMSSFDGIIFSYFMLQAWLDYAYFSPQLIVNGRNGMVGPTAVVNAPVEAKQGQGRLTLQWIMEGKNATKAIVKVWTPQKIVGRRIKSVMRIRNAKVWI